MSRAVYEFRSKEFYKLNDELVRLSTNKDEARLNPNINKKTIYYNFFYSIVADMINSSFKARRDVEFVLIPDDDKLPIIPPVLDVHEAPTGYVPIQISSIFNPHTELFDVIDNTYIHMIVDTILSRIASEFKQDTIIREKFVHLANVLFNGTQIILPITTGIIKPYTVSKLVGEIPIPDFGFPGDYDIDAYEVEKVEEAYVFEIKGKPFHFDLYQDEREGLKVKENTSYMGLTVSLPEIGRKSVVAFILARNSSFADVVSQYEDHSRKEAIALHNLVRG